MLHYAKLILGENLLFSTKLKKSEEKEIIYKILA